jgi:hypothetical protein
MSNKMFFKGIRRAGKKKGGIDMVCADWKDSGQPAQVLIVGSYWHSGSAVMKSPEAS